MVHKLHVPLAAVAIASASAVVAAAPAQADESEFLKPLRARYVYLSDQQLLTEGYKVCAVKSQGVTSLDAIRMVRADLSVSVATAYDIATTAVSELDC